MAISSLGSSIGTGIKEWFFGTSLGKGLFHMAARIYTNSDSIKRELSEIPVEYIGDPSKKDQLIADIFSRCSFGNSYWQQAKRNAIATLYEQKQVERETQFPALIDRINRLSFDMYTDGEEMAQIAAALSKEYPIVSDKEIWNLLGLKLDQGTLKMSLKDFSIDENVWERLENKLIARSKKLEEKIGELPSSKQSTPVIPDIDEKKYVASADIGFVTKTYEFTDPNEIKIMIGSTFYQIFSEEDTDISGIIQNRLIPPNVKSYKFVTKSKDRVLLETKFTIELFEKQSTSLTDTGRKNLAQTYGLGFFKRQALKLINFHAAEKIEGTIDHKNKTISFAPRCITGSVAGIGKTLLTINYNPENDQEKLRVDLITNSTGSIGELESQTWSKKDFKTVFEDLEWPKSSKTLIKEVGQELMDEFKSS